MGSSNLRHFLLVFDHRAAKLRELIQYDTRGSEAVAAYEAREREHRGNPDIEIVLIGSDSLATVRVTHANYFNSPSSVSKYFADLPRLDRTSGDSLV